MQATLNRLHQIDFQSTSPTLWTTVWRCFWGEQILANRIIPALHLVPECGRTFQENSASFTSPSYYSLVPPSEPERCEWRITATHGERIVLNITDLVTYPIAVWFVGKRELDFFYLYSTSDLSTTTLKQRDLYPKHTNPTLHFRFRVPFNHSAAVAGWICSGLSLQGRTLLSLSLVLKSEITIEWEWVYEL